MESAALAEGSTSHGLPTEGRRVVSMYLAHLQRRNLRPTYIDAQIRTLKRLDFFLGETHILEAEYSDLIGFIDSIDQSPESRATMTAHLRSFYAWAYTEGLVEVDTAARLLMPRRARRLPRPIPDEAIRLALTSPPDDVALILNLALYAGLRSCEVAQLRGEDFSDDPPLIYINESKGGGESVVPLSPVLSAALVRYGAPRRGWLFPRLDGQPGHHSRVRIGQIANSYLRGLGLEHTLHQFRHAYGSHLQRVTNGNLRVIQELMRHADPKSSAIYTQVTDPALAAAVSQIPDFTGPPVRRLRLVT